MTGVGKMIGNIAIGNGGGGVRLTQKDAHQVQFFNMQESVEDGQLVYGRFIVDEDSPMATAELKPTKDLGDPNQLRLLGIVGEYGSWVIYRLGQTLATKFGKLITLDEDLDVDGNPRSLSFQGDDVRRSLSLSPVTEGDVETIAEHILGGSERLHSGQRVFTPYDLSRVSGYTFVTNDTRFCYIFNTEGRIHSKKERILLARQSQHIRGSWEMVTPAARSNTHIALGAAMAAEPNLDFAHLFEGGKVIAYYKARNQTSSRVEQRIDTIRLSFEQLFREGIPFDRYVDSIAIQHEPPVI